MTMQGFDWLDAHAPAVVAAVLAVATVLAVARVLLRHWRAGPSQRSRTWRVALLVLAQPACAALLYVALVPPAVRGTAGTLVVATHGTAHDDWRSAAGDVRVALPESPGLAGAERVPDLATALRRYPATQRVRILGAGLEARDRDAAGGVEIAFEASPLHRGLVQLDIPDQAVAGADFRVAGRVHGIAGGEVELVDPASRRVDRMALQDDGRFVLTATARVPGAAAFGLRVRDPRKRLVESADVPIVVDAPAPPRVLLIAGAPGAELKFLRRWAQDAGLPVHTQIDLGGGLQGGDAPIALNAAHLARFDLVVLDERAWSSLGQSQRVALVAAVRNGLGMLLRITAAPSGIEQRRLRALGFDVGGGRDTAVVQLASVAVDQDAARARLGPGTPDAPRSHDADVPEVPALTRRAIRIAAADGMALLADASGAPFALWRAEGRGRIAVSALVDSHRLVLAGRSDLHGELWSQAATTLARARSTRPFGIDGSGPPGERIALCGVAPDARVQGPDGASVPLRVDPANRARACAAFFPRVAGWHRLESGDATQLFHVHAADALPGVRARERRDATLQLAAGSPTAQALATAAAPQQPGERWPWWLAWLVASGALWWFERARAGKGG